MKDGNHRNEAAGVILNVDDHEPARYARRRVLEQAGFVVFDGSRGEDALRLIEEVHPDLILLDVHLPDRNGLEVCRHIKSDRRLSSTIVIQISASATSGSQAAEAMENGADAYLTEPVDNDVLVATVRAFIRLRTAERRLAESNIALKQANSRLASLNQALRRSNDDLEHFASVASHDLQEPLRAVTTLTQVLERQLEAKLDRGERQLMHTIVESAQRMSSLVRDILSYSRAASDTRNFGHLPLNDSVDWAMDNLQEVIRSSAASVEVETLPAIWGDRIQLGQLFQNLISNAIKYAAPGVPPQIRIRAEACEDEEWVIGVHDNGVGIPEAHVDRVFAPFTRLHGREVPGTGIGLALCRRIVEGHGGRIWVESQVGAGSTFRFTLRAASASVAAVAAEA
ncbi:MAG: response regulator [Bryobacterales bacterium]|nr:response regulator [Bryobacterales bacterium]